MALKSTGLRLILPVLGLIVALLLSLFFYDTYWESGPDLLTVREWDGYRVSAWGVRAEPAEVRADGTIVSQVQGKKRGRISCRIDGAQPGEFLRLRGQARSKSLQTGKSGWHRGRVALTYADQQNRVRWNYPHGTGYSSGTTGWTEFELISPVQDYVAYARLTIANEGAAGTYEVRNLTLNPVRPKASGIYYFWGAVGCLVALGVWYCFQFRLFLRPWGWWVMLIALSIFTGVLLPSKVVDDAPEVTARVMEKSVQKVARTVSVQKVVPVLKPESPKHSIWVDHKDRAVAWVKKQDAHRWGHGGLFFLFGVACGLCFLSGVVPVRFYIFHLRDVVQTGYLFVGLFLFSTTAELIQVMAVSRTVNMTDWCWNLCGASGGLLFFVLLHLGLHPIRRLLFRCKK